MASSPIKDPKEAAEAAAACKRFGDNLAVAMGLRDMSAESLAEQVGVIPDTIYKYKAGKREPKFYLLSRIAKALRVEVHELYPGSDKLRLVVNRHK